MDRRNIGCSASCRATLLISGSVRDAMSPRELSAALAPPLGPRLLPCPGSGRRPPCLWTTSHVVLAHIMLFGSMIKLIIVHVLEEFMIEAGAIKGRDLRLEVRRIRPGASPPLTSMGMSCGWILRLRISAWLFILLSLVHAQIPAFRLWGLRFRSLAVW
jgi:hypothetical protein